MHRQDLPQDFATRSARYAVDTTDLAADDPKSGQLGSHMKPRLSLFDVFRPKNKG
jgi:hypothetical protein